MKIIKNRFGEDMVAYDSPEEQEAAMKNYLSGNLAALTCEEIAFWRSCQEDPYNYHWEAEHAGVMSEEVDPLDFYGLVFIHDLGRTFKEGKEILLDMVGPHPITPLTIWELDRELSLKLLTNHCSFLTNH